MTDSNHLLRFFLYAALACLPLAGCKQDSSFSKNEAPAELGPAPDISSGEQPPAPPDAQKQASETDVFSSVAARSGGIDSLKKFVRTAEMRIRVKNVLNATLRVEDIAGQFGGFVIKSDLGTEILSKKIEPLSKDSCVETSVFSTHNLLTIRVPYQKLDTVLRSIGRLCNFLDYRRVSAEDVGLQLLEQELERIRQENYRQGLENAPSKSDVANTGLGDKTERTLRSRAASDQAQIETMKLDDAIRFSTVQVDVYQSPEISRATVGNTTVAPVVRPFFDRVAEALGNGGRILVTFLLGILNLWSIILVAAIIYFLFKRFLPGNKHPKV